MSRNIIAILRGIRPEEAVGICLAIVEAGIDRIEVPLNSPEPFDSIAAITKALGDDALTGAGTVLTPQDVIRVHNAGGRLVVSPDCNPAVIAQTRELAMTSLPGVFSPTECFAALRAGADGLKLFPADLAGPAGLKALRAVLPVETVVYAVGGASPDNFADWLAAGASGFGIGTGIYRAGMGVDEVRSKAEAIVKAYDEAIRRKVP